MNILILNWRDPKHPLAGGAEKSVFEHAKYWRKMGTQVSWFSSSFPGGSSEEDLEGIRIIRRGSHYTNHIRFMLYYLGGNMKNVDLIIDCFHFLPYFTPLYIRRIKKIALIQETAGKLWFKNIALPLSLIGYFAEPLFFFFYRNVDFITASDSARKDLLRMRIKSDRITIIHHGGNALKYKWTKEKIPTILYLGLLSNDKGFRDASLAAAIVKKLVPSINYWVAGKESSEGFFKKNAGPSLKFAKYFGFVSEKVKFELFSKAWLLVHPSDKEGWGLTVIEAASQGTPTVGYNVPGLSESVENGQTGILTNRSPESLAEAIIKLIENKKLYSKMSAEALRHSKKFDWEKAGQESWKVINL